MLRRRRSRRVNKESVQNRCFGSPFLGSSPPSTHHSHDCEGRAEALTEAAILSRRCPYLPPHPVHDVPGGTKKHGVIPPLCCRSCRRCRHCSCCHQRQWCHRRRRHSPRPLSGFPRCEWPRPGGRQMRRLTSLCVCFFMACCVCEHACEREFFFSPSHRHRLSVEI